MAAAYLRQGTRQRFINDSIRMTTKLKHAEAKSPAEAVPRSLRSRCLAEGFPHGRCKSSVSQLEPRQKQPEGTPFLTPHTSHASQVSSARRDRTAASCPAFANLYQVTSNRWKQVSLLHCLSFHLSTPPSEGQRGVRMGLSSASERVAMYARKA